MFALNRNDPLIRQRRNLLLRLVFIRKFLFVLLPVLTRSTGHVELEVISCYSVDETREGRYSENPRKIWRVRGEDRMWIAVTLKAWIFLDRTADTNGELLLHIASI